MHAVARMHMMRKDNKLHGENLGCIKPDVVPQGQGSETTRGGKEHVTNPRAVSTWGRESNGADPTTADADHRHVNTRNDAWSYVYPLTSLSACH